MLDWRERIPPLKTVLEGYLPLWKTMLDDYLPLLIKLSDDYFIISSFIVLPHIAFFNKMITFWIFLVFFNPYLLYFAAFVTILACANFFFYMIFHCGEFVWVFLKTPDFASDLLHEHATCQICQSRYTKSDRVPVTVKCGHTFCRRCISESFDNGQFTCPVCEDKFCVLQFFVTKSNYGMLGMLESMGLLDEKSASVAVHNE